MSGPETIIRSAAGPEPATGPAPRTNGVSPVSLATKPLTRLLAVAALVLAHLGATVTTASAQGAVRSVHGDWQMRCDTPAGAQEEQCALIQNVTADDRENVGLSVIVLKTADKNSRLLRVLAPLGVLLPMGLGLRVDDADVGRAGFVRCLPNGCIVEVVMQDDLIEKMKTGNAATFVIFQTPEEGIGIPISLNGFSEGFDALP
ncbi:MAG: invasion-associated locus B family protein [Stappia sp.]|nr:invasion-associated locus B family protein [Stappia sp.]MBM21180.1 invasion-associated locus B family protein [Stappia sp.]